MCISKKITLLAVQRNYIQDIWAKKLISIIYKNISFFKREILRTFSPPKKRILVNKDFTPPPLSKMSAKNVRFLSLLEALKKTRAENSTLHSLSPSTKTIGSADSKVYLLFLALKTNVKKIIKNT